MPEEEYELTPELITEISKKSVEESRRISKRIATILEKISVIREAILSGEVPDARIIKVREMRGDLPRISCYAIDSSFKSPLPLVFGDLFIVIGGYVRFPRVKTDNARINRGLRVLVRCREELTSRIQSAISKIVERKIALEILRCKECDVETWNLLMIDGSIIPLWPTILFTRYLYRQEKEFVDLSRSVAEECEEKRKTILGIIKRVRTHFIGRGIVNFMKDKNMLTGVSEDVIKAIKDANDKVLATLLLNPGEALMIGTFGGSSIINKVFEEVKEKAIGKDRETFIEKFMNENPWIKSINVGFIKPRRSRHVVRIEILDYAGLGEENILAWLNKNSTHTACPYVLDVVDKYTAISNTVYELARKLMIKITAESLANELKRRDLEEVDLLLDLADLQKKYVPRMG